MRIVSHEFRHGGAQSGKPITYFELNDIPSMLYGCSGCLRIHITYEEGNDLWLADQRSSRYKSEKETMTTDTDSNTTSNRRIWHPRFGLRTLLALMVVSGLLFAWMGNFVVRVHRQRSVVNQLQVLGGTVLYVDSYTGVKRTKEIPFGQKIVQAIVGDDAFATVWRVSFQGDTKATDKDLALLTQLPDLRMVDLQGPNFTEEGLKYVCQVPELRVLHLTDVDLKADTLACLQAADRLTSLMLIELTMTDETLRPLSTLPKLEQIFLFEANVTSAVLEPLAGLPNLRAVGIHNCPGVDGDALRHLDKMPSLEILQLRKTSISGADLAQLRGLRQLQSLDLGETAVSDIGMEHIASLPKLHTLRLSFTQVGDAGLAALAESDSIEYLRLDGSRVTDAGMRHIAKMRQLRQLSMCPADVTDQGIHCLETLENLQDLSIGPTSKISKDAARKLKQALPNCSIRLWDDTGNITSIGGMEGSGLSLP